MLNFLRNLDRRLIFLIMGLAVAIPILLRFQPPSEVTMMDQNVFNAVEDLPDGSRVLLSFDFDPGSQGELLPMAMSFTRHLAEKKHKIYFMCLWPLGEPFIEDAMKLLQEEYPHLKYGTDYMSFGYKPGGEAVIKNIVVDWKNLFITDSRKQDLDEVPMTAKLKSAKSMDLLISISAGDPGTKQWIQYAATPADLPMVAGCTGVQAPLFYPYIPDPLGGLLAAIKGAAGYEKIMAEAYPALATPEFIKARFSSTAAQQRMGPQFVAHLLMVVLILLGNIVFFIDRSRGNA
ncbi:MAG: hypothetical protein HOO04_06950 [Phycisphaerae bacterium]|nr:hypothetical protein [Phycisphaerae bacterium]MBT5382643.1 hypothetical protein [Phycisphaerae bacterium]MBT5582587.1 hypothetical protein [Phycisphaerae bacterium]MBT5656369.1 hypothetical protein [Phycisphaerae bacterium]MBT7351024.1 hypothetical protein [Phycisphaerae bacterium]